MIPKPTAMTGSAALRTGYGIVIALLVFASFEAFRIQHSVSERHVDIYREHLKRDEAATELRRTIWVAGNAVREFFIDTRPETAEVLKGRLTQLKAECARALNELESLNSGGRVGPELKESIDDFWKLVEPVAGTMQVATDAEQYAFVQREIVPRRSTLYTALRDLSLEDQQALQQSEAEFASARQSAAWRLVIILASCVVLAIVVARFTMLHAGRLEQAAQHHYREVVRSKDELARLSARLVDADEEWRKRFSRELHDEIGQSMAALQMEIAGAANLPDGQPDAIRERLVRARDLVERTVQTVRDISLLLRPALLDDLGLAPALEWLSEDFTRRSGVPCAFEDVDTPDPLPEAVKTCVYRIVQESLHNAEKYAGASSAAVRVRGAGDSLTVEVEDNGRGFDPAAGNGAGPMTGLGIIGMKERAARLGGALTIDTRPGGGTRVRLAVPLSRTLGPERTREAAVGAPTCES